MYRDDRDALRDRVHTLEQELGAARGELDALRETLRVRNEQYEALWAEAHKLRATVRGSGLDMRPLQKLVVGLTPAFMVVSAGLFITGLLVVEGGVAWLVGSMFAAFIVWVLRWLHTGKV